MRENTHVCVCGIRQDTLKMVVQSETIACDLSWNQNASNYFADASTYVVSYKSTADARRVETSSTAAKLVELSPSTSYTVTVNAYVDSGDMIGQSTTTFFTGKPLVTFYATGVHSLLQRVVRKNSAQIWDE